MTPTPERGGDGPAESISGTGLRTRHPAERFMISSDSSHDSNANAAYDKVSYLIRSLILDPPIMTTSVATMVVVVIPVIPVPRAGNELVHPTPFADFAFIDMDTNALQLTYVPKWTVINDSSLDDPDIFRTRQTCLGSEVRLRLEHKLKGRKNFEGKCVMQADWLKERDAEIASLKAQLSLKEAEAAKAIRLCGKMATIEAAKAAWASELDGLKKRNAALEGQLSYEELSIKVASLESDKDKLIDQVSTLESICSGLRDEVMGYKLFKKQIEAVQDEQVKVLSDKVVGLDAYLMEMALHLDDEFYPRYLTTIAYRRWILSRWAGGRIDHGKTGRGLAEVAAYNPVAEAKYVAAVNALRPAAETPEASQLQPSPDQLMLPIPRLEDQVVIGETSLSFSLDLAYARIQRLRGNAASRWLSISDALVPLIGPLSAKNLVGEASTFGDPATSTTTALSTTFVQANTVPLVLMADHEVLGT
ncbi:hypothetical protein Tco_1310765 [Tanacetum coccineum]